jgi:hypothetical protein
VKFQLFKLFLKKTFPALYRYIKRIKKSVAGKQQSYELLNRTDLLKSISKKRYWHLGSEESLKFVSPSAPEKEILPAFKKYSGHYQIMPPFVCEIQNAELVGPYAIALNQWNEVILETAGCRRWIFENCQPAMILERKKYPIERTIDVACSMIMHWSHGYYHWITECLTMIEALKFYEGQTGRRPLIIVPREFQPWMRESLELMGYGTKDRLLWDYSRVKVRKLIVPSNRRYHETNPDDLFSPGACDWLRKAFTQRVKDEGGESNLPKKIYISRSKAKSRRVKNENELINVLHGFGFSRVVLEEMSFAQQVRLFSHVETVIGAHGAGLVNLCFSHKCRVIEFIPNVNVHSHYFVLAAAANLPYGFLECPATENNENDMVVSMEKLVQLIKDMRMDV